MVMHITGLRKKSNCENNQWLTKTIYSFDVFDTCLTRTSSSPKTVFYLMADQVSNGVAERPVHYEFVNARMRAERKARLSAIPGKKEDVTIEEIYQNIETDTGSYSRKDLMELELQVEGICAKASSWNAEDDNQIKRKGDRIFITDNYLPTYFIREQLVINGFFKEGDGLYVSQEIGLAKFSGNLFDYVKEKERTDFSRMKHYGDNAIADLQIPRSKGIDAIPLIRISTGMNIHGVIMLQT